MMMPPSRPATRNAGKKTRQTESSIPVARIDLLERWSMDDSFGGELQMLEQASFLLHKDAAR